MHNWYIHTIAPNITVKFQFKNIVNTHHVTFLLLLEEKEFIDLGSRKYRKDGDDNASIENLCIDSISDIASFENTWFGFLHYQSL